MLPALHFTRSTRILGCFASGGLYSYLTFALAALVIAVNIVLVVEFVDVMPVGAVVAVCVFGVFYFWICARLVVDDPIARAQQLYTRGTAARRLVRDHPTVRTAASAREAMLESYPALQATSWAVGRSRPRRSSTARRRRPRRRLGRRSGRPRRSCRQRALLATTCCRLSPYVLCPVCPYHRRECCAAAARSVGRGRGVRGGGFLLRSVRSRPQILGALGACSH